VEGMSLASWWSSCLMCVCARLTVLKPQSSPLPFRHAHHPDHSHPPTIPPPPRTLTQARACCDVLIVPCFSSLRNPSMKLSLATVFAAFFCSCSFPAPVHAFLLTNLASRGLKHPTPPQRKGLYSRVEYDAREPRLDEFGLPLDPSDLVEKPSIPLKVREDG